MKESKTNRIRRGWVAYGHWKETCEHDYIEGLWSIYSVENPEMSFTEYVRKHNAYNSLDTAIGLINTWERVKNRRNSMISQPLLLLGAIAGDEIGSAYENNNLKTTEFPLFSYKSHYTDDTVMTLSVANKLLKINASYVKEMQYFVEKYKWAVYGVESKTCVFSDTPNDSATRVSPIGYAFSNLSKVLNEAEKSAKILHNHP